MNFEMIGGLRFGWKVKDDESVEETSESVM